ncbi:MAG: dihydroorotate dehydrogenase electron transfer subunit [Candidatus Thermoplasmatota archaeon]|nr:dihydroorotate dehydrogenase electron transfer subunit [Candidatus Thermoplasmatota archaeon]
MVLSMDTPTICIIDESIKETKDIKTFIFNYDKKTNPGQFFMIWIPGVDEIPMSVSYIKEKKKGITFRSIGDATKALFKLDKDDQIGIRGPYGKGFDYTGTHLLFVGGGTGIAMIAPAIEHALKMKKKVTCVLGAKKMDELFFVERIKDMRATVCISTDDGSCGSKGYASDLASNIIETNDIDAIYTCGPEPMMRAVYENSKNIPFQASLERYMKCGVGICGQCCVGEGLRSCIDGPIFDRKTLQKIKDFGVWRRDASGKKIFI